MVAELQLHGMPMKKGQVWIGTSNVVVPGNKASFPEAFRSSSRLHYYARLFNSVEINSSFYKMPLPSTYGKWEEDVPADFRFTIKLSRDITHTRDLNYEKLMIQRFMDSAKGMQQKRGCLLIQFPGKISLDHFEQVEEILYLLEQSDTAHAWRKAVEFRHSSWFTRETWDMLDEFGAAMVLQDIPKCRMMDCKGNADFVYLRFHGEKGDYRGSYSNEYLLEKATEINNWLKAGKDVFAYFNNTMGEAFLNARYLQQLVNPGLMETVAGSAFDI